MNEGPNFAEVAALIGEPARANMLAALMDGRALTASELSYIARVSPQTTSGHLAKLTEARLLRLEKQGRHRYYCLASPAVGRVLEALMVVAVDGAPRYRPPSPRDEAVRQARTCYDHLAGRLGVAVTQSLIDQGAIRPANEDFTVTSEGRRFFSAFGLDLDAVRNRRRAFSRQCLDWSERRPHLAGALGAALTARCFELGWVDRIPDSRGVAVTEVGWRGFKRKFSLSRQHVMASVV